MKNLKHPRDATSSTPVDGIEPEPSQGVLEFFCLVEIVSYQVQIYYPEKLSKQQPHPQDHQQYQDKQQPSHEPDQKTGNRQVGVL